MKPSVIADTSALISLASTSDGNHTEATNISISIKKNDYPFDYSRRDFYGNDKYASGKSRSQKSNGYCS